MKQIFINQKTIKLILLDYIHNDIQQLNDQHEMDYLKDLESLYLLYQLLMIMKEIYVKFEYQFLIQSKLKLF